MNVKQFYEKLIQKAYKSPFHVPYRKWREAQQLRAFNTLLSSSLGDQRGCDFYSEEAIKTILKSKQEKRRPILGSKGIAKIVVFGTNDWEQFGFWPSLSRISEMHFFEYQEWIKKSKYRAPSEDLRRELNNAFIHFVSNLDRDEKITCAFFYADTKFISPECLEMLGRRGIWTVVLGLDDKHRFERRFFHGMEVGQATIAKSADLMWTTWKAGTQIYLGLGACPWYAPEAADPNFYYPVSCERDLDIVFLGQSYGWRRELVCYLRAQKFKVEAYGPGWENGYIPKDDMLRVIGRSKVVLGAGGVQSMVGVKHLKGRDFEIPMCSAVYLTSFNYELADFFQIGSEILCYSSFEECAEILHWILRNPAKADDIRRAALSRSLVDHTWERRLHQLFDLFPANTLQAGSNGYPLV